MILEAIRLRILERFSIQYLELPERVRSRQDYPTQTSIKSSFTFYIKDSQNRSDQRKSGNGAEIQLRGDQLQWRQQTWNRLPTVLSYRVSHKSVLTFFFAIFLEKFIKNAKVGGVLKNLGNLLHDRHKNFENWFRNSWDNWWQSCHPSF